MTGFRGWRRHLRGALLLLLTLRLLAQQQDAPTLRFDVAVIKPNPSSEGWQNYHTAGDMVQMQNVPVRTLISEAWGLPEDGLVIGGPAWLDTRRYDIDARMPGSFYRTFQSMSARGQKHAVQSMLQNLLRDRFQLNVTQQNLDTTSLVLYAAKGGAKLRPAGGPIGNVATPDAAAGPAVTFTAMDAPVETLATFLSKIFHRPVLDRTGLAGRYDFPNILIPFDPTLHGPSADTGAALQEQLGLTLHVERMSVPGLHVEHVSQPTDNRASPPATAPYAGPA